MKKPRISNNYTNMNVKYLRERKGIAQGELAEALNIDQSTLAKWEAGTRKITLEWSMKIAEYFNVFIGDFISTDLKTNEEFQKENELDQILFSKAKDLSDEDKKAVITLINSIKRNIDKEEDK